MVKSSFELNLIRTTILLEIHIFANTNMHMYSLLDISTVIISVSVSLRRLLKKTDIGHKL